MLRVLAPDDLETFPFESSAFDDVVDERDFHEVVGLGRRTIVINEERWLHLPTPGRTRSTVVRASPEHYADERLWPAALEPIAEFSAIEWESRTSGTSSWTLCHDGRWLLSITELDEEPVEFDVSRYRPEERLWSIARWVSDLGAGVNVQAAAVELVIGEGAATKTAAGFEDDGSSTMETSLWLAVTGDDTAAFLRHLQRDPVARDALHAIRHPRSRSGRRRAVRIAAISSEEA